MLSTPLHFRWVEAAHSKQTSASWAEQYKSAAFSWWLLQGNGRLDANHSDVSKSNSLTTWSEIAGKLLWTLVQEVHNFMPHWRQNDIAAALLSHALQTSGELRVFLLSIVILIAWSVGRSSTAETCWSWPLCLGDNAGWRHNGHPPSSPAVSSQDRTHLQHTRWPHGRILGSVKSSWHTGHSSEFGSQASAISSDLLTENRPDHQYNCYLWWQSYMEYF